MPQAPAPRILAVALAGLTLSISGCLLQADYSIKITTGDNVVMEVPVTSTTMLNTGDEAMKVVNFRFVPLSKDQQKAMGYLFEVDFLGGNRPTSIVVDDVSDQPILNVIEDPAPKLFNSVHWVGTSKPYNPADEHMNWVSSLDNGVRVFRFTVKMKDGTTHVLRLPILMPANTKMIFRAELGIK
ncbi:MAG TPA: hypothetical protein VII43_06955 [Opitutaceae bacterium]